MGDQLRMSVPLLLSMVFSSFSFFHCPFLLLNEYWKVHLAILRAPDGKKKEKEEQGIQLGFQSIDGLKPALS